MTLVTAEFPFSDSAAGDHPPLGPISGWVPSPAANTRSKRKRGWSTSVTLFLLGTFVLAMSEPGLQVRWRLERYFNQALHRPVPVALSRPDVVLISGHEMDRRGVLLTAAPRGYAVRVARDAEGGMHEMLSRPDRIGMVVVDGGLPGLARLERQARSLCPEAHVVVLSGARDTADVASRVFQRL